MVSLAELSINFGILAGFFFGWALRNVAHQWRWMLGGMLMPPPFPCLFEKYCI
jgi:hypothetical protein